MKTSAPGLSAVVSGLNGLSFNQPRRPWVATISPRGTIGSSIGTCAARLFFFDDFENDFVVGHRGRSIEQGAERFRCAALLSDDTPEIFLSNFKLEHGCPIGIALMDRHRRRIAYQRLGHVLDQFSHRTIRLLFCC